MKYEITWWYWNLGPTKKFVIWFSFYDIYVLSNEIHCQLTEVYVGGILRMRYVRKLCREFKNGPNGIHDGECTSQPSTSRIHINEQWLQEIMWRTARPSEVQTTITTLGRSPNPQRYRHQNVCMWGIANTTPTTYLLTYSMEQSPSWEANQ
jgi:hypothetical protein